MVDAVFGVFLITLCCNICSAQGPTSRKNIYATILQDARNEPTPDGTFGYLYKTEDGITSSARGGPNGVIQGGFSYTDPTGLKVNINYNAGSRSRPTAVEPSRKQPASSTYYPNQSYSRKATAPAPPPATAPASVPTYRNQLNYYDESSEDYQDYQEPQYLEPQPRYVSRKRPAYRIPPYVYQRNNRPINNDIYDDYNYRS